MQPKILFYQRSLAGGGAERVLVTLANNFAQQGAEVLMAVMSPPLTYAAELDSRVRLINLDTRRYAVGGLRLARLLRVERPVTLLSTLSGINFWAVQAKRLARVPVRVVLRETNTPTEVIKTRRRLKDQLRIQLFVQHAYPHADAVITPSRGVRDVLVQLTGISETRVHVIYNPAITSRFDALRKEPVEHPWFADGAPPVILGVGRLYAQKGFDILIRAVARVVQRTPVRLLILGEGIARGELESLVRTLGLEEIVAMPGFDQNPFRYMARAGVFVLSSRYEGMPNALIQALACGCRIVSTDCPSGPREVLDEGRYGRLVPVDDVEAMSSAILDALADAPPQVPDSWLDQFRETNVFRQYRQVLLEAV
ncbi:MAG: glycosyltransferase [Armatimonadetes bacterium]|nr:glycosyltransferase [Armatimonadota bacterium]CUU37487.1 Glycosyltransferase involved in cell wall bisynthesis [Armatimonadetes bacterium DC]